MKRPTKTICADIMVSKYEGDSQDLRIVLLGVSGAGKSSVGNTILGQDAFKESRTTESEIQRGRVEDRNISIINTPGFFNTHLTDEELQVQMMKSLDLSDPGPHVFLLVINLETFEEDERNIVEKIEEIFGVKALKFTMVLFTGRERISKKKWKEIQLSENFQRLDSKFKTQYHVINNKNEMNQTHIKMLLKKIDEFIKQNDKQHFNNGIDSVSQTRSTMLGDIMASKYEAGCFGLICVFLLVFILHHFFITPERDINPTISLKDWYTNLMPEKEQRYHFSKSQGVTHIYSSNDVRIVLLGKTGVGKSATGNTILGEESFKSLMTSSSVTRECQKDMTEFNRRWISVIDSPGLFDTGVDNVESRKETVKCISMAAPGPHVFLLVIQLGRFTQEEKDAVKMIQEMFGDQSRKYTMVLFTRGDDLGGTIIEEFIEENDSLQYLIQQCGKRYHVFNNRETKDQTQVSELLEKIDRMVAANGGSFYTNEMFQKVEKNIIEEHERILKEKEEEIKRREEELRTKSKGEMEQMKKEHEREKQEIQNEQKKREEEFRKREEEIKKETDENVRKEMKRKLEEQKKLHEEESKKKENALEEQLQTLTKKHEAEKQELKEKIQHETREQAEHEYREKLYKALEEAEAKLPYRAKRARDWGYYFPVVGAAVGAFAGAIEDIVY